MFQRLCTSKTGLPLLALVLLVLTVPTANASVARSDTVSEATMPPLVRVAPPVSNTPIGGTVSVDIRVEDVVNLFGFETVIYFDPAKVQVVDADPVKPGVQIEPGPFLEPDNPSAWFVVNSVDNTSGEIRFAATRMAPLEGVSGSGVVATVTYWGALRGHSDIALSESATLMLDPSVNPLPFATKSGGVFVGRIYQTRLPLTITYDP